MIYKSQKNAWMNLEIFPEWFKKDFVPAIKSHQRPQNFRSPKALLFIDNCSAHPDEQPRWFCNPSLSPSKHDLPDSANGSRSPGKRAPDFTTNVAVVGNSTESESVCSDEEDEGEDDKLVSTKEASQCSKKCLSRMESLNNVDAVQLMQLRRMMDFAM